MFIDLLVENSLLAQKSVDLFYFIKKEVYWHNYRCRFIAQHYLYLSSVLCEIDTVVRRWLDLLW